MSTPARIDHRRLQCLVQWHGFQPNMSGFVPLSMAKFIPKIPILLLGFSETNALDWRESQTQGEPHAKTLAGASQPSRNPDRLVSSSGGPGGPARWHTAPRHAWRYDLFQRQPGTCPRLFHLLGLEQYLSLPPRRDPAAEWKVVPELATSWEVQDEGRTWVFHLAQGVQFHDGTDFDAAAAKWNIERILDPEVHAWVQPYYTAIERVEAADTHTLRVRMKEPFGSLDRALAGYLRGIPMASPTSFATYGKSWVHHPTGTGPFILKEWRPGERVCWKKIPTTSSQGCHTWTRWRSAS